MSVLWILKLFMSSMQTWYSREKSLPFLNHSSQNNANCNKYYWDKFYFPVYYHSLYTLLPFKFCIIYSTWVWGCWSLLTRQPIFNQTVFLFSYYVCLYDNHLHSRCRSIFVIVWGFLFLTTQWQTSCTFGKCPSKQAANSILYTNPKNVKLWTSTLP